MTTRLDTMGRPVRAYAIANTCGAGHPKTPQHGRFYPHSQHGRRAGTKFWKCLTCQKAISAARRAKERAWLHKSRSEPEMQSVGITDSVCMTRRGRA